MSRAGKEKEREGEKLIVRNKRATFDYTLDDRFEAGLVLLGSEVKMLREGAAELTDSWCAIERGEVFLKGVNIPMMSGAAFGHEAKRPRKLLLHESEIEAIRKGVEREGMTVIATRLYFKNGRVKAEIALAKGKKTVDKRESLKEKDAAREARAAIERARGGGDRGRSPAPRAARSEERPRPRRPE
ncbi:SsrA-binding protein SmpB [Sorangium sp. So ce1014]|uniref:SsrA-binding protein SmpB n=1 Tax=Sorangium sp. So ce1014 TaxID=3133326 RepID=UPI003F60C646